MTLCDLCYCSSFFNDPSTTEIYTLSLHDALPIWFLFDKTTQTLMCGDLFTQGGADHAPIVETDVLEPSEAFRDRKSTRLNSSHTVISYAVFCLKKKKKNNNKHRLNTHH